MVLRSKHPDGVCQEVWVHLLVHHAICMLVQQAVLDAELDPNRNRLSFTRSLHIARHQVISQAALSPGRLARATRQAVAELLRHLLPHDAYAPCRGRSSAR